MTQTFLYQMAVIPAVLLSLAALFFLREEREARSEHWSLMFYLVVCLLFLSVIFLLAPNENVYPTPWTFELSLVLIPLIIGLIALILLNLKRGVPDSRRAKLLVFVLVAGIILLLVLLRSSRLGVGYYVLPGAFLFSILWFLGSRYSWLAMFMGVLAGVFMLKYTELSASIGPTLPGWLRFLFALFFFLAPACLVILPALLGKKGLQNLQGQPESDRRVLRNILLFFLPALLMLACLAYALVWGGIWDQTMDMGYGFMLMPVAGFLSIVTGMVMVITSRGLARFVGFIFLLLVPFLVFQSYELGQKIPHQTLTDNRAGRIASALQVYYQREGHYPEELQALVPRDLLFIPQPVILMGEHWCYQGGGNRYTLAAFYREFFSSPVSLRVYESTENPSSDALPCQDQLAEMKKKYYSPLDDPEVARPPVPTPLPDIEVGIPKTEIQPLLDGMAALPGSWSPDSSYFVFGVPDTGLTLHYLRAETGDICTADMSFAHMDSLRNQHAWLPDSRLLVVDPKGAVVILTPCENGGESLTNEFPERVTQIEAYSTATERMLLKSKNSYWLLNTKDFTVQPIPEVSPVPYDFHWDTYTWLPGSDNLVIARLNGRKGSTAGSTLFEIDGKTGEVQKSLLLSGEYGQSSPWIDGLSQHELLVHDRGKLLIVDFNTDPPTVANALKDIFHLDIPYPDEASAASSLADKEGNGYYLAVRLNHPHNQATYLYSSETDRVYEYDHKHHSLLLFPDGEFMEMPKQEDVLSYTDEYDVVRIDEPETVQPVLKISGHTPRDYPHLSFAYLDRASKLAVASAHGVSLVSLPNGEMEAYWTLPGEGYSPSLVAAPDGSALIATKDYGGLYFIPLPKSP